MGEDYIYMYKKLMPRFVVGLFLVIIAFGVLLVGFYSYLGPSGFWVIFGLLLGSLSLYFAVEYYHANVLVRGKIENVTISDLTKAIYWLSIINDGGTNFSLGGLHYWENLERVVDNIGSEVQKRWQTLMSNCKLPTSRVLYILSVTLLASIIVIPITLFLNETLNIFAVIAVIAIAFLFMAWFRTQYQKVHELADNSQARAITQYLIRELIFWTSTKTKRPIKVILFGGPYFDVQPVGSLLGSTIAEIRPKEEIDKLEPTQLPLISREYKVEEIVKARKKQRLLFITIHVATGIILGYFVFRGFEAIFLGKSHALGIFGLSLFGLVFTQIMFYFYLPQLKVVLTGGELSPFDLQCIAKRLPRAMLKHVCITDSTFTSKARFLLRIYQQKTIGLENLSEEIKFWIKEDEKQPEKLRFFKITENKVSLTINGELLAKTLREKLDYSFYPFYPTSSL